MNARDDFHGLPAIALRAPDGASARVTLHGAHVLSWQPAAAGGQAGEEQMFLSPRALFAEAQPIRGGVPVVFPQFSGRGPLPKHGLVRTRAWQLRHSGVDGSDAVARLVLEDDARTRAAWPHAFALELEVRVGGDSLSMALSVRNPGASPLSFTAALHTYLRVDDLERLRLQGLENQPYWDAVRDLETRQDGQPLSILGEVDRVYGSAPPVLSLQDGSRRLSVAQQGFVDTVVWNPGPQKCAALADMEPHGYRQMLCVEAGQVARPVVLPPQGSWRGSQKLTLGA